MHCDVGFRCTLGKQGVAASPCPQAEAPGKSCTHTQLGNNNKCALGWMLLALHNAA